MGALGGSHSVTKARLKPPGYFEGLTVIVPEKKIIPITIFISHWQNLQLRESGTGPGLLVRFSIKIRVCLLRVEPGGFLIFHQPKCRRRSGLKVGLPGKLENSDQIDLGHLGC